MTNLRAAIGEGYKIRLYADGIADVVKPDGTGYFVNILNDGCDCLDALRVEKLGGM